MRIIVAESTDAVARVAADAVEAFITTSPSPALGLATGGTMEPVFTELVRRHREQGLSFADVRVYLLDEYVGLDQGDPCSYRNVTHRLLARHVDLRPDAIHGPNPHAANLDNECACYEQEVRSASVGLQLLGIGSNGHVAFNEPGSPLNSVTRVVELSRQTQADNARFFPNGRSAPARAITQGIATIGAASELVLVACGYRKAHAVARAIEGPVTSEVPASTIQLHPNVTVVLKASAANCLSGVVASDATREPDHRSQEHVKNPGGDDT